MDFFDSSFAVALSAIFTIVNPLGAVGPFIAMTANNKNNMRISIAQRACRVSFIVLLICSLLGSFIFKFFGITIPALQIAGGILLLQVAIDMVNARASRTKTTAEEAQEGKEKDDVAIFPLGVPLLSGPGAIVTVIILTEKAQTLVQHLAIYTAIVLTMIATYFILVKSDKLHLFLGQIGINVFSRLMGLILAAISVQFMITGLKEALPGLVQ